MIQMIIMIVYSREDIKQNNTRKLYYSERCDDRKHKTTTSRDRLLIPILFQVDENRE